MTYDTEFWVAPLPGTEIHAGELCSTDNIGVKDFYQNIVSEDPASSTVHVRAPEAPAPSTVHVRAPEVPDPTVYYVQNLQNDQGFAGTEAISDIGNASRGSELHAEPARSTTFFDLIFSIPQTVLSVVHLAPAPAPETQTAEGDMVVSMVKEPSSGNPDESMQVVVLPPPVEPVKEQSAIMQDSVQMVLISDQPNSIQPPPDIPQYTGSGNGTLLEEVPTQIYQISLPQDSAGNRPQTGPLTISCPAGSVLCQAGCVDIMTDTSNCGSCNNACSSGYLCFLGECQPKCPGGQTFCNGACASLLTDPNNCGACGHVCTNGGTCGNGQCVLPMVKTLPTHPGDLGIVRQHL